MANLPLTVTGRSMARGDGGRMSGGNISHVGGDNGGDIRWTTYAELAEARGIKPAGAVRLVQRRKWLRQPGNDGSVRVAVPILELRPSRLVTPDNAHDVAPDNTPDDGGDVTPDNACLFRALEGETTTLRYALARERHRADTAETREAEARCMVEQQGRELTASLLRTAIAETEARALREALDEARRPLWRRLFGA